MVVVFVLMCVWYVEKDIRVVRGKYCQCTYSWNTYDPYGIGPDRRRTHIP